MSEAAIAVMGMAVNQLGARVLYVLQRDGDGQDVHLPIVQGRTDGSQLFHTTYSADSQGTGCDNTSRQ